MPLLPSQLKSKGNQGGSAIATIMDNKPFTNIPPFVTCKYLTLQASGTPMPCVPAFAAPWTPGSPTVLVEGKVALNNSSKLLCSAVPPGVGTISISYPGQTTVSVP